MQLLAILSALILSLGVVMRADESLRVMITQLEERELDSQVESYGRRIEAWRSRFGVLPGQLDSLQLPGEPAPSERVRFALALNVDDGALLADRAVIWKEDPLVPFTREDNLVDNFLTAGANQCGGGDFATGASFCPSVDVKHEKSETRDIARNIATARKSIHRTLEKIAGHAWIDGTFPATNAGGTLLVAGSTTAMADLVGYVGPAADCDGQRMWADIPFGCDDLFVAPFGTPVMYVFESDSRVGIFTETGVLRSNGEAVIVGENLVR